MTKFTSNIGDLVDKWLAIDEKVKTLNVSEALVFGVNAARARMENRIFNKGLDVKLEPLGIYRGKKKKAIGKKILADNKKLKFFVGEEDSRTLLTEYEEKRVKKGRQVRYKDLEFSGTLRRGIVVIKETESKVVCAAPSKRNKDIIEGQEKDLKTTIFTLSDDERDFMRSQIKEAIKQKYAGIFNS